MEKNDKKNEKITVVCWLCFLFGAPVFGALLPFVAKSLVYPVFYEKREETGIIESIGYDRVKIVIASRRHRNTAHYKKYYFTIDGIRVEVPYQDGLHYEEGESYRYFLYERNGEQKGDSEEYLLWKGILGALTEILFFAGAAVFIFTRGEAPKEKRKAPLEKTDYSRYSAKELYEICLEKNLKVIPEKRKNREYLTRCLMKNNRWETYCYHTRPSKTENIILKILVYCSVIFAEVMCMRHIYYLFYTIR